MSEWDKKAYYGEQARPKQPCQAIDPAYHKKYRPKEQLVCQISHISISLGNPELRYLWILGQKVPFHAQEFINYCAEAGWPQPEIQKDGGLDIEVWLIDRARALVGKPADQVRRGLTVIAKFARLVGLHISYNQFRQLLNIAEEKKST